MHNIATSSMSGNLHPVYGSGFLYLHAAEQMRQLILRMMRERRVDTYA